MRRAGGGGACMEEEMEVDPRYVFCVCVLWCGTVDGEGALAPSFTLSCDCWWVRTGLPDHQVKTHCACMYMHMPTYHPSLSSLEQQN